MVRKHLQSISDIKRVNEKAVELDDVKNEFQKQFCFSRGMGLSMEKLPCIVRAGCGESVTGAPVD